MRVLMFIGLLLISSALSAQSRKAKKILDKLSETYTQSKSIAVEFDLIVKFPEEDPTSYSSVVIQKGNKFLFQNSEQEYYGNGDDIWIYLPAQNEVQINDYDEEESEDYFITPLDLLNQYKSGKYDYQITDDRKGETDIEFMPLDEFNDYSKFRITVTDKQMEIAKILAFGKDGSLMTLDIRNINRDKEYDDQIFEFDRTKYPGVRIEDLRLD